MKATFALLADRYIYNLVRKIAWEAHRSHGIGLSVAYLEPHVSLKQPFEARDFAEVGAYMDELSNAIAPFEIHLTALQAIPVTVDDLETGILWLDVAQTDHLYEIHQRVNRELEARFGPTPAAHDGDEYHFHMTVAMGHKPFSVYQEVAETYGSLPADLRFTARELALFVYDEDYQLGRGYMTYKILPLTGS